MKYSSLIIIIFLSACTVNSTKLENRAPYNSKGLAYIFNIKDYEKKIITGKLDNSKLQVSHSSLKPNTLIKVTNPVTNKSLIVNNSKRISYPDFYKILISEKVAKELNINIEVPLVEILEIKKNKSFVAKKAIIYKEEKKISTKAPVTSVQISNLSKNNNKKKTIEKNDFFILLGTFYSIETAEFLKDRIIKEIHSFNNKKLIIQKKNVNKINLKSGPYKTINLMKNDYIQLKKFGFEELDIITNE